MEDLIPAKAKGWHLSVQTVSRLDGEKSRTELEEQISAWMEESVCMMRIDKYLAEMGQGTRSEIKKLIRSGRVMVDGETVKKPEFKIDETTQKVSLEGKQIGYAKKEYYMLYKPAGVISATKDDRDKTVLDLITDKKEMICSR